MCAVWHAALSFSPISHMSRLGESHKVACNLIATPAECHQSSRDDARTFEAEQRITSKCVSCVVNLKYQEEIIM